MISVSNRFTRSSPTALCMSAFIIFFAIPSFAQAPVSFWHADRNTNDSIGGNNGTAHGGVTYVPGIYGSAFDFDGSTGGINIADNPSLAFTSSFTISAWADPSAFPDPGNSGGQVFFRGDDRYGLDPYYIALRPDENWTFAIYDANDNQAAVAFAASLNHWVLLTGTLDATAGLLSLYIDDQLADQIRTTITPFATLDPNENPGVSIGDTQAYPNSDFHETFAGKIDEVAAYDYALSPAVIREHYAHAVALDRITLKPRNVAGGTNVTGTVKLNLPAPQGGALVTLSSSDPSVASVPQYVFVPAQAMNATFTVSTHVVTETTPVTISGMDQVKKGIGLTVLR